MNPILENVLTQIIAPLLLFIAGYLGGKRKSNADAVSSELANVEKGLEIYRKMVTDLEAKIERLESRIVELQTLLTQRCTCQKQSQ